MQKIFDQADQTAILKDAQNAYKDLNMSVNQYLSSINQVGATFAQTMGDQKGYDVARKGMKAIADYSSGTGRNLEELNQKYGLIIRSASTYQSIADQFSGILPATSKDFLAQAQAAGILSDKYKNLTDVPIAEYQEAVTIMLEKGVDAMGLLGNTAAETEHTLSGAVAGMKAAWENWLVSLVDPSANGEEATRALMESLKNVVALAAPAIGDALGNLLGQLPEIIMEATPDIVAAIVQMVLNMGESFMRGLDKMFSDFGDWVAKLVNGTETAGDEMAAATAEGVDESLAEVKRLPAETEPILSNLDYSSGGFSVGESFADGIRRSIHLVKEASLDMAAAAHAAIPNSPAKIGAFSGKGWTLYSGESVADAFAEGFRSRIKAVQNEVMAGMDSIASIVNGTTTNNNYSVSMNVTADSTTTLDSLIEQARRARISYGRA